MKFQNMIRTQLVLAGLGVALLFASSASAQEIENAAFYDGPNVESLEQATATQPTVAANPKQANSVALQSEDTNDTPVADLGGGNKPVQDPMGGAWLMTTCLLISMALIAVYALAGAKRDDRNLRSRRRDYASPRTA